VTDNGPRQLDAFTTPGTLLKAAREAQGIPEREAADRLNLMPGYVAILERDDYQALRSPPFARGYVKAYGKLLGLDEGQLLDSFDQLRDRDRDRDQVQVQQQKRIEAKPLQLQRTGLGVMVGLAVLLLLVLALWWWQGDKGAVPVDGVAPQSIQNESVEPATTGEQ
jgi:cytoskeletal protein RodZ